MNDDGNEWMLGLRPVARPRFRPAAARSGCQHCLDIRRLWSGPALKVVVDNGTDLTLRKSGNLPEGSRVRQRREPSSGYKAACRELLAAQSELRRLGQRIQRLSDRLDGQGWAS